MKKVVALSIVLIVVLTLIGCAKPTTDTNAQLTTNQTLAISTYLASELLATTTGNHELNASARNQDEINYRVLSSTGTDDENSLNIERQLEEVNFYFNKLKPFIDEGVNTAIEIEENISTTHKEYEQELTYKIADNYYTIFYSLESATEEDEDTPNLEEEEFILSGIMVIDGIEYVIDGEKERVNGESEMWFETIDDTGNYVYVEIAREEDEQYFAIETEINGVEKVVELEIEQEGDETEIEIELTDNDYESSYELKKAIQDDQTIYKLEYEVNELEGEATITEVTDEDGNVTYHYEIKEQGMTKEIEIEGDERR
ncbi:hypothetical protein [Haloplasma contractile]|uniref:Membrane lipoprotein n=1 Tax=Haloplasma contractile SSD-17B TaxID=1033810 RepID=F7Q0U1_9MOLU|nr:hypothetical protein [Haloplasma contractile]ERJ11315.1 membrane lipoprotein [Haloplasma contractile SSD-17B]